jgi:hypothetical protein
MDHGDADHGDDAAPCGGEQRVDAVAAQVDLTIRQPVCWLNVFM